MSNSLQIDLSASVIAGVMTVCKLSCSDTCRQNRYYIKQIVHSRDRYYGTVRCLG